MNAIVGEVFTFAFFPFGGLNLENLANSVDDFMGLNTNVFLLCEIIFTRSGSPNYMGSSIQLSFYIFGGARGVMVIVVGN